MEQERVRGSENGECESEESLNPSSRYLKRSAPTERGREQQFLAIGATVAAAAQGQGAAARWAHSVPPLAGCSQRPL